MSGATTIRPAAIGARYGVIAGLICISLTFTLYKINPKLLFQIWGFSGFAAIVLLKIWSVFHLLKLKKYVEFKEGLQAAFMVSAISLLMWISFAAILISVIDPSLVETQKEVIIERIQNSNLTADQMKIALESVEKEDLRLTFSKVSILYGLTLFVGFIYSV